jgi:hypothetical protein
VISPLLSNLYLHEVLDRWFEDAVKPRLKGRSRNGRWVVKRKTAKSRFSRAVKRMAQWCREHRHASVAEQHEAINRKLRGHYVSRSFGRFATAG